MKQAITIYSNGMRIRKRNKRITAFVSKDKDGVLLTFERFDKEGLDKPTCGFTVKRGITKTQICLSRETMDDLLFAYIQYKIQNGELRDVYEDLHLCDVFKKK